LTEGEPSLPSEEEKGAAPLPSEEKDGEHE
jgi:hypothetical protein